MDDRTKLALLLEIIGIGLLIGSLFTSNVMEAVVCLLFGFASALQGIVIRFKSHRKEDFWDRVLKGGEEENEQRE